MFINQSPLNNAIFTNLQQITGDMRSVILAYTDVYISKPIKAKERIYVFRPIYV